MRSLHVGAVLQRPPTSSYLERFGFAELMIRPPVPQAKTLRRWRYTVGEAFKIGLNLPDTWLTELHSQRTRAFQWMQQAAEVLHPAMIVVCTPPELTPGQRHRDQLLQVFEALQSFGLPVVWQASGLWSAEVAARVAVAAGVIQATDPRTELSTCLQEPSSKEHSDPPRAVYYSRIHAAGILRSPSSASLYNILSAVRGAYAQDAYVSVFGTEAIRYAATLLSHATAE